MKKNLWCAITLTALLYSNAFAQSPLVGAVMPDNLAHPSTVNASACTFANTFTTEVVNTGTGICTIPGGSTTCQVMVWDKVLTRDATTGYPLTSNAYFSWDYQGTKNSITLATNYYDPDVVIQNDGTNVWAIVVMEKLSTGDIYWLRYKWTLANTFVLQNAGTCRNNSSFIARNPNIDVSPVGRVAITWHEEGNYSNPPQLILTTVINGQTVTLYNNTIQVKRGEILLVISTISGEAIAGDCSPPAGITLLPSTVTLGYNISPASTTQHPFEKNNFPDVAISDEYMALPLASGYPNWISVSWLQSWFNPGTFSFQQQLIVCQIQDPTSYCPITPAYESFVCDIINRPRIDARMGATNSRDYSVVMASSSGVPCTVNFTSKFYNWAKQNGTIVNSIVTPNLIPSPISLNTGFTSSQIYNPVVAYRNSAGDYTVSWTNGVGNIANLDVLARTFTPNEITNTVNPATSVTGYSIVNRGDACTSSYGTSGIQQTVSIANPTSTANTTLAYSYWDTFKGFISYKKSSVLPGGATGLRNAHSGSNDANENLEDESLKVAPNPFSGNVTFNYSVAQSAFAYLEVLAPDGRQVYKTEIKEKTGAITWNTSSIKTGNYIVRLVTSKNIITDKLSKQ